MAVFGYLRKSTRFALATFLWLHALFLLRPAPVDMVPLAARVGMSHAEFVVVVAVVGAGLLKAYGWKNVIVDLLYIWCFPVVLPCLLVYWTVVAVQSARRVLRAGAPAEAQGIRTVDAPVGGQQASRSFPWRKVVKSFTRSVLGFATLWGLLVVFTTHIWTLRLATLMVLVAIARMLYVVLKFFVFSTGWLSSLEASIQNTAEKWIACIGAWVEPEPSVEVKNAWNGLRAFQFGVKALRDRRRVTQWTIGLGGVVFVAVYAYAALLFSFSYVGLARLSGVALSWSDALLTSLLLPISYGDLPRVALVRLLGGLHYAFLVVFGFGSFWSYVRRQATSIHTTIAVIALKLDQDEVKNRFNELERKLGPQAQVLPKDASATTAS